MSLHCSLLSVFVSCLISHAHSFSEILSLSENKTVVSPNGFFELGLLQQDSGWYVMIWRKDDSTKISLWVANRNAPLKTANGRLGISEDNKFVLLGRDGDTVWGTVILSGGGATLKLFDHGNLAVVDSNGMKIWQSFDSPSDTLLPQMVFGARPTLGFLNSWTTNTDPGIGRYSLGIAREGKVISEIFVQFSDPANSKRSKMDVWDGKRFGDMPAIFRQENRGSFIMKEQKEYTRLTLSSLGKYEIFTWNQQDATWTLSWPNKKDICNNSASSSFCGTFSYCSTTASRPDEPCFCIKSFIPVTKRSPLPGLNGCTRGPNILDCTGDVFVKMENMRLPGDWKLSASGMQSSFKQCENKCLEDCDCMAFAFVNLGIGDCVRWEKSAQRFDILRDRWSRSLFQGGCESLRFRLSLFSHVAEPTKKPPGGLKPWTIGLLVAVGVIIAIALCLSGLVCLWWRLNKRNQHEEAPTETQILMNEITGDDHRFEVMDLSTIRHATDNFASSNELGRGGFGTVYKGILTSGREVAVKRLSTRSSQGLEEFRNEVNMILNVLHRNLVRIVGCCCDETEKLLVYEYLANSSLNRYIFDEARSHLLNWENRFRIIKEIAQGLSYLHNFTERPIIHRDLKPSNVLLGSNMIAKISDFGLAAILERGQTEALTERVVGTHGYMSEEYALRNIYSDKSDVFSFGVLLLEIITGRRNVDYCRSNPGESLLGLAWSMWNEMEGLDLVDSTFIDSTFVDEEVLRCIQIGLWCVQDHAEDRPTMDSVILMLGSTNEVPSFNRPDYYYCRRLVGEDTESSLRETSYAFTLGPVTQIDPK